MVLQVWLIYFFIGDDKMDRLLQGFLNYES